MLLLCLALLALAAQPAAATHGTAEPLPGSTFQGADGDHTATAPLIDWQQLVAAGKVATGMDPNDFDTIFEGGDKELEPGHWGFTTAAGGATPGKDNILEGWYATELLPHGSYLYFGFHRASTTGNTFLGFELNQQARSWVNATGTVVPCRIAGDALLSYEVEPSSPHGVHMVVYRWTPTAIDPASGCSITGTFDLGLPVTAQNAQGTINFDAPTPSHLPGSPASLPAGSFGEGSVNITSALGDSCTRYIQVQLHSRSAVAVDSALKDYVAPVPISLGGCGIAVDKTGPPNSRDGASATYGFAVTNTGTKPLADVSLTDDRCAPVTGPTGDADGDGLLDVDETWRYGCTRTFAAHAAGEEDPAVNTATAQGTAGGERVTATDSHSTDLLHPALELDKRASAATAHVGDELAFDLDVRNTGDTPLDVTVSDPRCDAGTLARVTGDATFDPGETWTYRCTHRVTAADADPFVNTATATGTDAGGGTATDSDSASVDVLHPGIALDKRASAAAAHEGDELTFDLLVTNTGDTPLDVAVDDPRCDPFTLVRVTGDASFDPGETWTYRCRHRLTAADADPFLNTATATGTDALGEEVTATDSASVDVLHPGIALDKRVDAAAAHVGDELSFELVVRNTGDTPLTVAVSDPRCDAGTLARVTGDASLDPGETWTYACRHRIGASDGDPFVNTATATGRDALGREVVAADSASVDVLHPGVSIDKRANAAAAHVGDQLTFDLDVRNTGDTPLDVTVTDPRCDAGTLTRVTGDASFGPGETWTYRCTHRVVAGDADPFVNTATVVGTDAEGGTAEHSDTVTTDVLGPNIALDKRVSATAAHRGDELTFDLLVTNTGDATLSVDVDDPRCDPFTLVRVTGDASFDPGETWTYRCTHRITAGDADPFVNTATATGTDSLGHEVTATDAVTVDLLHPGIGIDKRVDAAAAHVGDELSFELLVTNTGDAPLTVTVSDPRCDAGTLRRVTGDASFDPGETWTYACRHRLGATDSDPFVNTATATGEDALGREVAGTDTSSTDVLHPAVSIDKRADATQAHAGDQLTFELDVRNTGDTPLDVAVSDPRCDAGTLTRVTGDASFDPGETWTYRCTHRVVAGDADPFVNTASVVGTDPEGGTAEHSDTVTIDVLHPGIAIDKRASASAAHEGDELTFDLLVTNTGDTPLDVRVADPRCDASTLVRVTGDASFDPGETWTYRCTHRVTAGDADPFVNTATATGTDPLGETVTADDAVTTDVLHPGIELEKRVDAALAHVGDLLTFELIVRNTGDTPLTVAIDDPRCDAGTLSRVAGDASFDPGDTWRYSCTHRVTAGDPDPFVNTATATGTDAIGGTTTSRDETTTDVLHPAMTLEKRASADVARVGEEITFELVLRNTGDTPLEVTVSDPRCDAGTLARVEGDGSFDPGETWRYTCRHVITAGDADPFVNTATAIGTDPAGGTTETEASDSVAVLKPGLTLDKQARVGATGEFSPGPLVAHAGDVLEYRIVVANTGELPLDVALRDPRCDAGTLTGPEGDADGDGRLGVGETWTYRCSHLLTATDPDPFENTATVTGTDDGGAETEAGDSVTVDRLLPGIALDKRVRDPETGGWGDGPVQARPGQTLHYDLEVRNTGDAELQVTLTDEQCDAGTLTGPEGDADGDALLDVAEVWVYRCRHRLRKTDPLHFVNVASVTGRDAAGGQVEATDEAAADVVLTPRADLFIQKTGPGAVAPEATIAYTLAVGNDGPSDATDVVVEDRLPAGTTFVSATPTQGTCELTGGAVRCALGDLPAGASAQIALVVRAGAELSGTDVVNTATVDATEEDPDAGDNSSSATVTVRPVSAPAALPADLVLDKALVAGTARVGETLRYRITAVNDGPGVAEAVTIVDTLSSAVRFVSVTPSRGRCTGTVVVTCRLGDMAAGERATIDLEVVALRAGALRNVATGAARGMDPTPANNETESLVTVAPPMASGTLSKVAHGSSAVAGRRLGYTITYRGLGPGTARNVVICDRLPAGLTFVSARGGRLTAGGRVCWRRAAVKAGQTIRLRLTVRVDADVRAGRIRNVATLEGRNSRRMVATSLVRSKPQPRRLRQGGVTG